MKYVNYRLYNFYLSSPSYRVRIALNHKHIPYEYISINLKENEQYSIEYTLLNPNYRVPCLVFRDIKISESPAILEYLEEVHPEPPLLPKNDPVRRAHIKAFTEVINSSIYPLLNMSALRYKFKYYAVNEEDWIKHWGTRGFYVLEKYLTETKGKYCFGDTVTMADVYFYPYASAARRYKVNLDDYPLARQVLSNLEKLEAFYKSNPEIFPYNYYLKRDLYN